jgi:hypothetical protein
MLVTAGHNKKEYNREKLLVDTLWMITTRELNNRYRKLQQHIKKRETKRKEKRKKVSARGKRKRECRSKCPTSSPYPFCPPYLLIYY